MQSNSWMLHTRGDPLGVTRRLLRQVWINAAMQGMIMPVYQTETLQAAPQLVDQPQELASADPFVPFVPMNTARLVSQLIAQEPRSHYGAVLRSCEARALSCVAERDQLVLDNWLVISVDCLASFPVEEYEWRVDRAGRVDRLTREVLRFARQGGIAPYRYRRACQMCVSPLAQDADLSIGLLGLPIKDLILVTARDEAIAERLCLAEITDGPAPLSMLEQRQRLADRLCELHQEVRASMLAALAEELPQAPQELLAHLGKCAPCQLCLEVCPVYAGELSAGANGFGVLAEETRTWLASCVYCGMCEQACPRELPLTAIHTRISLDMS